MKVLEAKGQSASLLSAGFAVGQQSVSVATVYRMCVAAT
jgi:hypothetical protein